MPVLSNPKWELFAQEVAKGTSGAHAYQKAGYKANANAAAVNANRLLKDAKIRARVDELLADRDRMHIAATERAVERLSIDREWVISKLVENARVALGEEKTKVSVLPRGKSEPIEAEVTMRDAAAANRALELLGKELGMFIDRSENVNVNHIVSGDLPTQDEWEAEHSTTH